MSVDFNPKLTVGVAPIARDTLVVNASTNIPTAATSGFDDEFNSGSADLAVRGWGVSSLYYGGNMTRAGDVVRPPYVMDANTYRSTFINGQLFIQPPRYTDYPNNGAGMLIYKATGGALAVGTLWYVCGGVGFCVGGNTSYLGVFATTTTSGIPNSNNKQQSTISGPSPVNDIAGLMVPNATQFQPIAGDSAKQNYQLNTLLSPGVGLRPPDMTFFGFSIGGQDTLNGPWFRIRFFRVIQNTTTWIPRV